MEIEQYLWGASPEGEGILLYVLRCPGGPEVRITNAGAAVTGIFVPGTGGAAEPLTPVFETPEALSADCSDRGRTLCGNIYGFGRRIWESRVETNRVVMESAPGERGEPAMAVLFDLEDDGQFVVTHLARGAAPMPFAMTTQLFWQGEWRPEVRTAAEESVWEEIEPDEGRFYPVAGWKPRILGAAARLHHAASGRTVEILSSYPEIRIVRDGDSLSVLCGESRPAPLAADGIYCHKTVYRFI